MSTEKYNRGLIIVHPCKRIVFLHLPPVYVDRIMQPQQSTATRRFTSPFESSPRNFDLCKANSADHVFDYRDTRQSRTYPSTYREYVGIGHRLHINRRSCRILCTSSVLGWKKLWDLARRVPQRTSGVVQYYCKLQLSR